MRPLPGNMICDLFSRLRAMHGLRRKCRLLKSFIIDTSYAKCVNSKQFVRMRCNSEVLLLYNCLLLRFMLMSYMIVYSINDFKCHGIVDASLIHSNKDIF